MHRTDFTDFDDPAVAMAHKSAVRSIERVVHETVPATPPQEALEQTINQLQNPKNLVTRVRACPRRRGFRIIAARMGG